MGVKLTWPSQASKNIDSLEIYRGVGINSTLDRLNLPAPLVTLSADKTAYEDTSVVDKTIYNYWIASVKNGERVFSFTIQQGYYLDTGPGPSKLLMGDWSAGYFGRVAQADLFTNAELNAAIGNGLFTKDAGDWHKFVYKGRIIFTTNTSIGSQTIYNLFNNGLLYGRTENVTITPTGGTPNTPQKKVITKSGRNYIARLPYVVDYDTVPTAVLPTADQKAAGEWQNTIERLLAFNGTLPRFGDETIDSISGATSAHGTIFALPYNAQNGVFCHGTSPGTLTTISYSTTGSFYLVLELVLP